MRASAWSWLRLSCRYYTPDGSPGQRFPELIHDDDKLLENSFVVPDAAPADVPAALRGRPTRPEARRCRPGTGVRRASVREGVREVVHHQRLFNTRGAREP